MIRRNGSPETTQETVLRDGDAAVVREYEIDCFDGHAVSIVYPDGVTAIADAAVEFRHEDDVSWTNLETTPYDTSPWAGTGQVFQLRETESYTTPRVQAYKIRVGPP